MKILKPGQVVIDCGAAPGSWSEVAVEKINSHGKDRRNPQGLLIALDLLTIHPIEVNLSFAY